MYSLNHIVQIYEIWLVHLSYQRFPSGNWSLWGLAITSRILVAVNHSSPMYLITLLLQDSGQAQVCSRSRLLLMRTQNLIQWKEQGGTFFSFPKWRNQEFYTGTQAHNQFWSPPQPPPQPCLFYILNVHVSSSPQPSSIRIQQNFFRPMVKWKYKFNAAQR